MALRDQPYLPLYIQDFLTDEKLMECSAAATGVYIRIMCVMHKSDPYGTVLLGQKDKQTDRQVLNFATKLARHFPYPVDVILLALEELLTEKCLYIEGDFLVQKRMLNDGKISLTRSKSGSLGGKKTKLLYKKFALAKNVANTEYENEYENDINNNDLAISKVSNGDFKISKTLELPTNCLEVVEMNQFTHTRSRNTEFIKEQWLVFLAELLVRPEKERNIKYRESQDVTSYFVNWMRNKFPSKSGTHKPNKYEDEVRAKVQNYKPTQLPD